MDILWTTAGYEQSGKNLMISTPEVDTFSPAFRKSGRKYIL
jgi:hypothetical protein